MNIRLNPTPYIIKRGIILYESAVIKKNSQYIKVKYNSIPLIINKNVFIAFIILYALVKLQMNYTFGFGINPTYSYTT